MSLRRSSSSNTFPAMSIAAKLSPVPMTIRARPQSGTSHSGPAAPSA